MTAAPEERDTERDKAALANVTVDQILDKFIAAVGAPADVQKLTTRVSKGNVVSTSLFGGEGEGGERTPDPVEILSKAPAKRIMITKGAGGYVRSVDGSTGWRQGQNITDMRHHGRGMRGDEIDNVRLDDFYFFANQLKPFLRDARVARIEAVDGKDTFVILARTENLPEVHLYFERDSGLLVRSISHSEALVGRFTIQVDFSDFRTVDGVKMPFKWTSIQPSQRAMYTYQIEQVQHNVPIDDARFVRPRRFVKFFE